MKPALRSPCQRPEALKTKRQEPLQTTPPPLFTLTKKPRASARNPNRSESARLSLREADQARGEKSLRVNLFVGPEGGFTEDEIDLGMDLFETLLERCGAS